VSQAKALHLTPEQISVLAQYAAHRIVGQRFAAVEPLLYGTAHLKIGRVALITEGNDECYQYKPLSAALEALKRWDGVTEPTGWFRCVTDGRRRIGGDPCREYFQP
jgi:hypothetical protein